MTKKKEYRLIFEENPSAEEEQVLMEGIENDALELKHEGEITPIAFFIKDSENQIMGGIKGTIYYGGVALEYLWTGDQLRNQGWGSRSCKDDFLKKTAKRREEINNTQKPKVYPFLQGKPFD